MTRWLEVVEEEDWRRRDAGKVERSLSPPAHHHALDLRRIAASAPHIQSWADRLSGPGKIK
jgi:hypothetical protein